MGILNRREDRKGDRGKNGEDEDEGKYNRLE